jgi:predicted Na+-dependent transporter
VSKTARNVLIILVVAAAVAFLPGGGNTAQLVSSLLGIGLAVIFVLLGVRYYRENRVAVFALGGRSKLLDTGLGSLVFVVLLVGAVGALYAVWQHHREYGY